MAEKANESAEYLTMTLNEWNPESWDFIQKEEAVNKQWNDQTLIKYPQASVGERIMTNVSCVPESKSVWVTIIEEGKHIMALPKGDWLAFMELQHLIVPLLKLMERGDELRKYVQDLPEIKRHPRLFLPPGAPIYIIDFNKNLSAEILHMTPRGYKTRGYCVKLRHKEPRSAGLLKGRDGREIDLVTDRKDTYRSRQILFSAGEFDYFSRYVTPRLRDGILQWEKSAE